MKILKYKSLFIKLEKITNYIRFRKCRLRANLCFRRTISEQYGVTDPSLCLPCQHVCRCLRKLKDVFSNIIVYCTNYNYNNFHISYTNHALKQLKNKQKNQINVTANNNHYGCKPYNLMMMKTYFYLYTYINILLKSIDKLIL